MREDSGTCKTGTLEGGNFEVGFKHFVDVQVKTYQRFTFEEPYFQKGLKPLATKFQNERMNVTIMGI